MCLAFWHPLLFYSSSCLLHPTYLYLSPNLYLPLFTFLSSTFRLSVWTALNTRHVFRARWTGWVFTVCTTAISGLGLYSLYQWWTGFSSLTDHSKCSRLQVKTHHTVRYSIHFKPSRLTSMACFKSPVSLTCYLWFVGGSSQRALTRAHEEHENSTQGSNQELSCRWATGLTTTTPRSFVF